MTSIAPEPCQPEIHLQREASVYSEEERTKKKSSIKQGEAAVGRSFLTFLADSDLQRQYQSSQREYLDFFIVIPLLLITFVAVATRTNLANSGTENAWLQASLGFTITFSLIFVPYVLLRIVVYHTPLHKKIGLRYRVSERLLRLCYRGKIEDILGVLAQISAGLCLLGRVYAGQCDSTISIWSTQSCNTVADMNSIPGDQVILLYALPLGAQCVLRGISVYSLVACCILSMLFVVLASVHVGGLVESWTVMYAIAFLIIMLMVERLMFATFMQGEAMLAAVKLNARHELELLELSRENERKLKEKEICQLRSLLGNAAHDLKTPLHSIEADLDVLNTFMSGIPKDALLCGESDFQINGSPVSFDPQSIFDSLTANCKFMAMAINRSQDFMKASNNIALVPMMETFELASALAVSVTCMHHVQSTRTITVHSIDSRICSHLISDKHWLSENVLCLLSNALKYSDDGAVDLRISLINASTKDDPSSLINSSRETRICEDKEKNKNGKEDTRVASIVFDKVNTSILDHSESIEAESTAGSIETRSMVLVTVEDTGIGIAKEARANLFKSFKQVQRMAGGTGLGLYSLSKRVAALDGMNGVSGRTDGKQGSMFWFTFPYRPDEDAKLDMASSATSMGIVKQLRKDVPEKNSPLKKMSILLVDDSISILKVTSRLLKINGHDTETAANGFIGLKMLKEVFELQRFDMVLTDLQMPVMDGIEATRRYREFEKDQIELMKFKRKKLLIVGMSANSDDQSKQEALDSGMNYFITKPFSYHDLRPILQDIQMKIESTSLPCIGIQDQSSTCLRTIKSFEIAKGCLASHSL